MTFTFLSSPSPIVANTPDLCSADIAGLVRLRPSECDPAGRVGPDLQVRSTIYNNDEHHTVTGSPTLKADKKTKKTKKAKKGTNGKSIIIYLPGKHTVLSLCLTITKNATTCIAFHQMSITSAYISYQSSISFKS